MTETVALNLNVPPSSGRSSNSTSGLATGLMPDVSAAVQNQESRCPRSASCQTASRPTRAITTGTGAFPRLKPGNRRDSAMSVAACSNACWTSASGTSTSSRTRLSGSSSTFVFTKAIVSEPLGPTGRPAARLHVMEVEDQAVRVVQLLDMPARGATEAEDPGERRLEVAALAACASAPNPRVNARGWRCLWPTEPGYSLPVLPPTERRRNS